MQEEGTPFQGNITLTSWFIKSHINCLDCRVKKKEIGEWKKIICQGNVILRAFKMIGPEKNKTRSPAGPVIVFCYTS